MIDTNRDIREVSLKAWNGSAITGLRLTDGDGNHVVDINCTGQGIWQRQEIESGQEIIGLQCNTTDVPNSIPRIAFVTWTPRFTEANADQARASW